MILLVSVFHVSVYKKFEFCMVAIVGSTNDEFLDMRELTLDRIEP